MRNRGALYMGLLLLGFGSFFMLATLTQGIRGFLGRFLGYDGLWPMLIILAGAAFLLPIAIWWDKRASVAGLVVPGVIITFNGLMLFVQNWTGAWRSWAYAWALEPVAVGASLWALYTLLGQRPRELRLAAGIVAGVGAVLFVLFASLFGGAIRYIGPAALIAIGALVITRALTGAGQRPQE
jgi:hypothetical protein